MFHFSFVRLVWLFAFALFFWPSAPSWSRPLTGEDRGYALLESSESTAVQPDGQTASNIINHYRVLTENGVRAFTVHSLNYNSNTQKITLKAISVINPEGTITVDPNNVEDKSLFSGDSSYDETRTKMIPLPGVRVGSEIRIEYVHEVLRPPFPGVISGRYHIAYNTDVATLNFTLAVPASASVRIHDPSGLLKGALKDETSGATRKLSVALKDYKGIGTVLENNNIVPPEMLAWIDVSSIKSWEDAAAVAAKGFDKALAQPLPEAWRTIFGEKPVKPLTAEEARARLNAILQTIADNYRYFGDWRSIDGGYVPRALSEVARTGYGDCKDFAVLVASAARYLGLAGNVALTSRGMDPYQIPTIPNLLIYNHAITRVGVPGTTESWWIDATNPIPQVGIVPVDIAGRHALLLGGTPGAADIPRDGPDKSGMKIALTYDASASPDNRYMVDLTTDGHSAWYVKNELRGMREQQIQEYVINYVGVSNYDAKDFKLLKMESSADYPFTTHFQFQLTVANGIARAGDLKILPVNTFGDPHERIMDALPSARNSDIMLGSPKHITVSQTLSPGSYQEVVGAPQSCDIKSPWLEYKREVENSGSFVLKDEFTLLKYRIPLAEIRSAAFLKVQQELRDCLKGVRVVVK